MVQAAAMSPTTDSSTRGLTRTNMVTFMLDKEGEGHWDSPSAFKAALGILSITCR